MTRDSELSCRLHLLSQCCIVFQATHLPWYQLSFVCMILIYLKQLFCIIYLSSTSPGSQTGGCLYTLTVTAIGVLSAVSINTSTTSDLIIISQLNRFTFFLALLLPVLRLNLTLSLRLQGLGTFLSSRDKTIISQKCLQIQQNQGSGGASLYAGTADVDFITL